MASQKSTSRFFIASGCPIATTTRYRCLHLQEQLKYLGYESEVAEWFEESVIDPNAAYAYDAFFLYRLGMSPPLDRLISEARKLGKPVIFDVDDLVFEPALVEWHRGVSHLNATEQELHKDGMRRYRETLLACDAATMATPLLAQFAHALGRAAYVHRNALGNEMLAFAEHLHHCRQQHQPNERLIIGYGSGTPTHEIDFQEVAATLLDILGRFPQVELWIVGPLDLPPQFKNFELRVRRFPLTDWRGWFERASQMDIALAPLERDNVFCRAKSEIKFVEAGVLGVPVVASKIDPFQDAITHGVDGFLAENAHDWNEALILLIEQPKLRQSMGEEARRTVLRHYDLQARAAELASLLPRLLLAAAKQGTSRTA